MPRSTFGSFKIKIKLYSLALIFNNSYNCVVSFFQYCDTYPECLCVPSATTTQTLIGSCKFRSRARLPVLTYFHRPNAASISRFLFFISICFSFQKIISISPLRYIFRLHLEKVYWFSLNCNSLISFFLTLQTFI